VTLALVVAVAVVSACSTAPPTRRDLVVGLVGEPRTVFDDDPSARFVANAVTETLVRRDARDELIPRLAESVPTLENGGLRVATDDSDAPDGRLVARFRLRNAKWQDGEPVTATDVRFAWERDKAAPVGTLERWTADRISDVQVLALREVRVLYRNGERWDDYALGPHVMPSHRLAQATPEQRVAYAREPVHAGSFAIAAWLPGNITLSSFKDYVLGAPKLGRLEIHFFTSRGAALQALLRGDIDVAPSPVLEADLARTLDRFADGTRLLAHYVPTEALTVLRFGPDPKRFGDPRVREAIELTIDRQSIVNDVFVGRARVPRTYLVPPLWAAAEDLPAGRLDRERARGLLASAGFTSAPSPTSGRRSPRAASISRSRPRKRQTRSSPRRAGGAWSIPGSTRSPMLPHAPRTGSKSVSSTSRCSASGHRYSRRCPSTRSFASMSRPKRSPKCSRLRLERRSRGTLGNGVSWCADSRGLFIRTPVGIGGFNWADCSEKDRPERRWEIDARCRRVDY
jgi:ABC-type transport system substrate-binding protein